MSCFIGDRAFSSTFCQVVQQLVKRGVTNGEGAT